MLCTKLCFSSILLTLSLRLLKMQIDGALPIAVAFRLDTMRSRRFRKSFGTSMGTRASNHSRARPSIKRCFFASQNVRMSICAYSILGSSWSERIAGAERNLGASSKQGNLGSSIIWEQLLSQERGGSEPVFARLATLSGATGHDDGSSADADPGLVSLNLTGSWGPCSPR